MIRIFILILCLPFFLNAQSVFISGDLKICSNSSEDARVIVSFSNGNSPFNFVYAIDGINQATILTDDNPYYINTTTPGVYTLSYFADAIGNGVINGSAKVEVMEAPIASFNTDSDTLSILYKSLNLNDISIGDIVSWNWSFGDNLSSTFQSPTHSYQDAQIGVYEISLIVIDDMGCTDTARKNIFIEDHYWMYIPNAFTPNSDGINDKFCIEYNGIREATFLFKVFDPNGDIIFRSTNPDNLKCSSDGGWDGSNYLTGEMVPELDIKTNQSYVFTLYHQDFEGWKYNKNGKIILVR